MGKPTLPITLEEAFATLCLPPNAVYGIRDDCENCSKVWTRSDREWFLGKLAAASRQLRRILGAPIAEEQIVNEAHALRGDCKIQLKHTPVCYLGKQEILSFDPLPEEYEVCYTTADKCGVDHPQRTRGTCDSENHVGYIHIPELPEGVTPDQLVFSYTDEDGFFNKWTLPKPRLDYPQLCTPVVPAPAVQAVWLKRELLHPARDYGYLKDTEGFIKKVKVEYCVIDEEQAVTVAGSCSCGTCGVATTECLYTAEIGDPLTGEICIKPVEGGGVCCGKHSTFYICYGTKFETTLPYEGNVAEDLKEALALLALRAAGQKLICNCKGFDEIVRYWLEDDPAATGALITPEHLPYSSSRAGVRISEILRDILNQPEVKQKKYGGKTGSLLTSKKKVRGIPSRRYN